MLKNPVVRRNLTRTVSLQSLLRPNFLSLFTRVFQITLQSLDKLKSIEKYWLKEFVYWALKPITWSYNKWHAVFFLSLCFFVVMLFLFLYLCFKVVSCLNFKKLLFCQENRPNFTQGCVLLSWIHLNCTEYLHWPQC